MVRGSWPPCPRSSRGFRRRTPRATRTQRVHRNVGLISVTARRDATYEARLVLGTREASAEPLQRALRQRPLSVRLSLRVGLAVTEDEALDAVDGALRLQAYRPVAADLLSEAGEIDIASGIPRDLIVALRGVTGDPTWKPIAEQLALLRTRSSGAFRRLYLTVRKNLLCLAVVYVYYPGFRGFRDFFSRSLTDTNWRPRRLTDTEWRSDFDWTWDVLRFLEPYVGKYRVNSEWSPAIREAVTKYGDAGTPSLAAGLSLLTSAIELSEASRGPCGTFIGVSMDGFDDDLSQRITKGAYAPTKSFFENIPSLSAYGWWPQPDILISKALPEAVERASLQRSLTRISAPAREQSRWRGFTAAPSVPRLGPKPTGALSAGSSASQPRPDRVVADAAPSPEPTIVRARKLSERDSTSSWYKCGYCSQRFVAAGEKGRCPWCRREQQL